VVEEILAIDVDDPHRALVQFAADRTRMALGNKFATLARADGENPCWQTGAIFGRDVSPVQSTH